MSILEQSEQDGEDITTDYVDLFLEDDVVLADYYCDENDDDYDNPQR